MAEDPRALRSSLLRWYDGAARDLPWRHSRDPYAIWVSEIMLQQTRVETVLRYYDRFLARFPTPYALAAADEDAVMAAWSGLGYYRRARHLQQGVREVVARYGGQVPLDAEQRRALPGVGRYTAGAIGSIAFDLPEPIVDGNVARVLCRVHAIDTPLARSDTQRALWEHAAQLVVGERPGALNQALMELGATLCGKQSAQCRACPIRAHCRAFAEGKSEELPVVAAKPAPRVVDLVALVVIAVSGREDEDEDEDEHGHEDEHEDEDEDEHEHEDAHEDEHEHEHAHAHEDEHEHAHEDERKGGLPAILLERGGGTLFGGLWNLPAAEGRGRAAALALLARTGATGVLEARAAGAIEHVLTHRKLRVQLWRGRARATTGSSALRAVPLRELDTLGVSKLTRKALDAVDLGAQRSLESVLRTY